MVTPKNCSPWLCTVRKFIACGLLVCVLWLVFALPQLHPWEANRGGHDDQKEATAMNSIVQPVSAGQSSTSYPSLLAVSAVDNGTYRISGDSATNFKGVIDSNVASMCKERGNCATNSVQPGLLVAVAARQKQFDDLVVVINSAVRHASNPSLLHFRIVTSSSEAQILTQRVRKRIKRDIDLEAVDFDPWVPQIRELLGGASSSRKELFDELNFAAFYLHEIFPSAERALYLDTDVVVLSDIAKELGDVDFHGHPAAAARDCSQRMGKYCDFDRIEKKGLQEELHLQLKASKKSCVVNRGVVLVNIASWRSNKITETIEQLVRIHLSKQGPLWRSGVSQPPFLLAVDGRYLDVGSEYNVRGLGRGDIAPDEVTFYKKQHKWNAYYDQFLLTCQFHCCPGCKGWALSPYISPAAHQAKIIHFNGRSKPKNGGFRKLDPVAAPPKDLAPDVRAEREQRPLCSCGQDCLQECASIWWEYMIPE